MLGIEGVSVIAGTLPLRLNDEAQQMSDTRYRGYARD